MNELFQVDIENLNLIQLARWINQWSHSHSAERQTDIYRKSLPLSRSGLSVL